MSHSLANKLSSSLPLFTLIYQSDVNAITEISEDIALQLYLRPSNLKMGGNYRRLDLCG